METNKFYIETRGRKSSGKYDFIKNLEIGERWSKKLSEGETHAAYRAAATSYVRRHAPDRQYKVYHETGTQNTVIVRLK